MKCAGLVWACRLILTGFLSTALLCGCSMSRKDVILQDVASDQADQTTLTFFGFKADARNLTAIENALQKYRTEHPDVHVTYEGIKGTSYHDILKRRFKSDHLDDVFMIHQESIPAMKDQLADLSDLSNVANYMEDAKSQFVDEDGSVLFLPTCISTYNLYINTDLLKKDRQPIPENLNEFSQVCNWYVSQGMVPIIANNFESLPALATAISFFDLYQSDNIQQQIEDFNQNPESLVKTCRPGLEFVEKMVQQGWINPAEVLNTKGTSDDLDLFAKGDRPFMITGGWATVRLPSKGTDFHYGVYPFPILEDGSVLSLSLDTCIALNKNTPDIQQAKEFVNFLISEDVMWEYCDSQASFFPLEENDRMPSESTLLPSVENMKNGKHVWRTDYRFDLPVEAALQKACTGILEGKSLEEAQMIFLEGLEGEK